MGGRAYAERNVVTTGNVVGAADSDAIRVVGSGSYLIAHNTIDCGWMDGTATGISVIGTPPPMAPATNAIIVDNDVTMSAPDGTVFTSNSAAIEIRGFAQANSVLNNRIQGRANAGLVILDQKDGMPSGNSFVLNDLAAFKPSVGDIFVDQGAIRSFSNTRRSA